MKAASVMKALADREAVQLALEAENIEARPVWPPACRAYASERSQCICKQSSTAVQACPPESRRGSGVKSRTKQKEV